MERTCTCESCGAVFEAARSDARFCGERCRKRAQRGAAGGPVRPVERLDDLPGPGLAAAVLAELEAAGRVDTAGGQSALTLARRIEDGRDTGSAIASLNREMRATLAEAVKGAKVPLSSIESYRDELADRRRA